MIAIKQLIPQLSCRIQLSNSDVLLYPPRTRDGVTIRYSTISCEHSANRLRAAFLLCCLENVKDFLLFTTKCEPVSDSARNSPHICAQAPRKATKNEKF